MPPSNDNLSQAIFTHLSSKHVPPTQQWLHSCVSTLRPNTPLIANQKTAEYRLFTTDFTTSLQTSARSCFPAGIASPEVQEQRVPGPVPVQVLDIEDIGHSRWSQVEAMEMEERGETRKGQEVIRVVPDEENEDGEEGGNPSASANVNRTAGAASGPHKLLLQDAKGNKAYAFEMESVEGIKVAMPIGSKMVIRDFTVARGVILLSKRGTEVLGGKVEAWDKKWRADLKKTLKDKAGWRENMGANVVAEGGR